MNNGTFSFQTGLNETEEGEGEKNNPEYVEQHARKLKATRGYSCGEVSKKVRDREGDRTATYDLPIGLFVLLRHITLNCNKTQDAMRTWSWSELILTVMCSRWNKKYGSVDKRIFNLFTLHI